MVWIETSRSYIQTPAVTVEVLDHRNQDGKGLTVYDDCHRLIFRPDHSGPVPVTIGQGPVKPCGRLSFYPANLSILTMPAWQWEELGLIRCRFSPSWFSAKANIPATWTEDYLGRCADISNDRIGRAVEWMGNEAVTPGFSTEIIIESLAAIIAHELAQDFPEAAPRVRTKDRTLRSGDCKRIVDYIESYVHKCPSLEEISKEFGISDTHLCRSFKQTTGMTIHKYVENVRLKKARYLLSGTDLPLKEIAHQIGFSSASALCSAFKRSTGQTPNEYRNLI